MPVYSAEHNSLKHKISENGLEIEYELIAIFESTDVRSKDIIKRLQQINKEIENTRGRLEVLKTEIYNNTSHADKLDYLLAACSGILCGFIDVFFVGEFDFKGAKAWSNKKVNNFVMKVAKMDGYKGDRLDGAIKHLEDKHSVAHDNSFMGTSIGVNAKSHHLDDMAHHPSIIGLIFSMLTQFTVKAYYANKNGEFHIVDANPKYVGKDFPEKIFKGTINWFFHLVSDMSGSAKTAGKGMGIPGPILSFAKEISSLPFINKTNLPKLLDEIYEKNNFDFRSELAVAHELGRQSIPVIINEILVRCMYFIKRFINELKLKQDINLIDWKKTFPFKNPTISRMMTVASGAFLIVDVGDAALRSGGNWIKFFLRVNIVNCGRFTIAVGDELRYMLKREQLGNEYFQQLMINNSLYNLKLAYQDTAIWLVAKDTVEAINSTYNFYYQCAEKYAQQSTEIDNGLQRLRKNLGLDSYKCNLEEALEIDFNIIK